MVETLASDTLCCRHLQIAGQLMIDLPGMGPVLRGNHVVVRVPEYTSSAAPFPSHICHVLAQVFIIIQATALT